MIVTIAANDYELVLDLITSGKTVNALTRKNSVVLLRLQKMDDIFTKINFLSLCLLL